MGNKRRLLGVRQILALVLAVVVTVSTMPVSAYAATDAVVTETVVENETDVPEESAAVTETEEVSDSEESGESVSVEESMPAETETEERVEESVSTEAESVEETTPEETESVEEIATEEETETLTEETETLTEETVEETTTEELLFESVIMKDVSETSIIIKDSNNNYQLTATVYDDTVTQYAVITKYTDMGNSDAFAVTIPAMVNYNGTDVKVTAIGEKVFYNQTDITTLYFEEGCEIATIKYKAFEGCKFLTYMDPFPESLTNIGYLAFSGCTLLGSLNKDGQNVDAPKLVLPAELETIGQHSFYGCEAYKEVFIPKTLKTVTTNVNTSYGPFGLCDNLTEIVLEDGIERIPSNLFCKNVSNSKNLSIKIPDSVTHIENNAFYGNTNLVSVSFGENSCLSVIGARAFYGCTKLGTYNSIGEELVTPEIFLPSGLTKLGYESFLGCTSLKKIVIPASLNTVSANGDKNASYGPFYKCDNLTDISFEDGITAIPSNLFYKQVATTDKRMSMVIPASVITINASAFKDNPNIESITFEGNAGLTSIGKEAFYNCTALAYCEMPEKLTSIGENAFYNNVMLERVIFEGEPQLVTVGKKAFYQCTGLCYFEFPDTVTTIQNEAFAYCEKLGTKDADGEEIAAEEIIELALPEALITLNEAAFSQCHSLEKVIIPKGLTTVTAKTNGPFANCHNLTDISIAYGMQTVPSNLFKGRIAATNVGVSVTIPDTVTTIGAYAFEGNTSIKSMTFGEDSMLDEIGKAAFRDCTALCYFEFPDTVRSINVEAFKNCTLLGTKDASGELLSPAEIVLPIAVETIWERAFAECDSVEKIVIPFTLKKVGQDQLTDDYKGPFSYCDNLTDISFQEGITKIPEYLFDQRISSTDKSIVMELPESVTTIGTAAFRNCTTLAYIGMPDSITLIEGAAFKGCTRLGIYDKEGEELEPAEVILPDRMEAIGERAFEGCISLEKVVIPNTLKSIKDDQLTDDYKGPFSYCDKLTDITFEYGIDVIPDNMFDARVASGEKDPVTEAYLYTLSFDIPDTVKSIGASAFKGQVNARAITIGENSVLTSIGNNAFLNCGLITEIYIPDTVKTIGNSAFKKCASLENVTIPDAVTSIGEYAFQDCVSLKWAEFEVNNLYTGNQSLGKGVFRNCESLTTMKFGNKLTGIPGEAFYDCSSLIEVEIPYKASTSSEEVFAIGKDAFKNCESLRTLFIPSSVKNIYTAKTELAYCYEQGLKIYVEKGDSKAKEFATKNGWETEVGIYCTADEFPDPQLYLQMKDQRYDKNLDTRLTLRELEKIVDVDLSNLGIKDMTGTELFTSLESMNCSKNEIAKLDTSTWTKLKTLNCANNDIEDLDFANNKVIETLDCSQNRILVFGLSGIKSLKNVTLGSQSGNMYVEQDTYGRMVLPLPKEYPSYLQKAVSDISDIDALAPARDGIIWTEAYDVPDLVEYHYTTTFGENQTEAEAVVWVNIFNAGIEITSKEYTDPVLRAKINEQVDTNKNGLISKTEERACKELDVTGTDKTEGTEEAKIRDLTGIGRLSNLEKLICKNNKLESLDLSNNVKLEELDCSKNSLTALSLVQNSALRIVNCNENKIKNINFSNNKALIELYCESNELAKLDLSENTQLEVLRCGINSMAALDLSNNEYVDALIGTQEFTLEREYVGDENADVYVRLSAYDEGFVSSNVSNVVVYVGDDKDTEGEYFELTEDGFMVKPLVTKIAYNYTVPQAGDRALKVTVNLVDEITTPEEIILTDISTLRIDKFVDKIYTGEPTCQDIVIWDGEYMLREDLDYEVTYVSNTDVGTATVIIQGIEDYSGVYEDTYEIIKAWDITVSAIKDQTFQNKKIEPKVTVKLGKKTLRNGVDYEVEFLNNKDTGVATALIKGKGKTYGESGMKAVTFNIVECKISKASLKIDKVVYNGMAQQPEVIGEHSKAYLKEGEDFLVVYTKNVNAGKGTATIIGIGNYTGSVKKTFVIDKIDIAKLKDENIIVGESAAFSMTGAKADVSVTSGDYVMEEGKDYSLSYSKNKAIGNAKVTIKGKGNCKGSVTRYFEVKPQSIADSSVTIDVAIAQVDSKGRAVKPKVTVTQDKKKLSEGEKKDYVVEYNKDATKESGAYTITVYGKNRFGGSEEGVEKEFIIVDQLINKAKIKGLQNWEYDGTDKEQLEKMVEVIVGKEEVPSYCYDISYDNNVNVGNSATIIITANPKDCDYAYGGTVSAKFKITPVKFSPSKGEFRVTADFEDMDYDDELEVYVMPYGGQALEPEVVVYDEELGVALEEGTDYKLKYQNNVKVGKSATVTITGAKNYTGSVKLNFSIVPKDMYENTDDFKVIVKNSAYTGKEIKPRITVKDGDITLKQNTDYTVKVEQLVETEGFDGKIKNKGKYVITIVGKGNYTNELNDIYYLSVY